MVKHLNNSLNQMDDVLFKNVEFVLFLAKDYSLNTWVKFGTLERDIAIYRKFAGIFKKVSIVSYGIHDTKLEEIMVLKRNLLPSWLFYILCPFILQKYIKKSRIYKSFQFSGALPAAISKIFYGGKFVMRGGYILSLFSKDVNFFKRFLIKVFESAMCRISDAIFIPSEREREYLHKNYRVDLAKIHCIPNYIDTGLFKPDVQDKKTERIKLCYVGRFDKQKNPEVLLEIIKSFRDLDFIVVGDGEWRESVVSCCNKSKINLEYFRVVNNYELVQIYNQCHIFVFPSLYEGGSPKSVLEAMACGLPVVALRSEGTSNVIDHAQDSFLEEDVNLMIKRIKDLIENKQIRDRIGKAAREKIIKNFSLDYILEKELNIYRELLFKE